MRQFIVQNEQAGKDSTRVITLFNRIMEQEPDEAQLPLLYAQYLSKGMNKEAGPVLRQVLAIDPTNTAARGDIAGEAVRQEDYKEIMNLCEAGGVQSRYVGVLFLSGHCLQPGGTDG